VGSYDAVFNVARLHLLQKYLLAQDVRPFPCKRVGS